MGCRVIYEYCLPRKVYRAAPRRFYLASAPEDFETRTPTFFHNILVVPISGSRRNGKGDGIFERDTSRYITIPRSNSSPPSPHPSLCRYGDFDRFGSPPL